MIPKTISSILLSFSLALPGLAQTTPPSPAPASAGGTLPPVVVTAEGSPTAYVAPTSTSSGLKTDTPLLETPQAISVVPEAVIRDQGTPKLEKALRNVAGVTPGGYYQEWDYYRLRGFDASFETFRDGLRGDYGMNSEMFGVERMEVIKGPASSLYGQGPLGGMVNLVSKRPSRDRGFSGEVGFTGGSWDYYEGTFDVNIPLVTPVAPVAGSGKGAKQVVPASPGTDTGVYARLVGLYRNAGSFIDHAESERYFFAPSLTWDIGPDTSITFLSEFVHDETTVGMPLPATGTVRRNPNGNINIRRFIGAPGTRSNGVDQTTARVGYEFTHQFSDAVRLRQNFSYARLEQEWSSLMYPSSLSDDGRTLLVYPYDYNDKMNRFAVDTAVDIKFETGSINHTLTLGTDFFSERSKSHGREINYDDPNSYVAIDLFRPSYSRLTNPTFRFSDSYKMESLGLYGQDHIKLTDKLTFTAGLRYDMVWEDGFDMKDGLSPKAGITYEFVPGVAVYANYSRSFQPQGSYTDASGEPVDPEEGENYEAGIKYSLMDGRLTGMVSVFHLTRQNVATANLSTPDPFDSIVSGEQRARGVEFETAAELMSGLNLIGAYTFLDGEVTEDNDIRVGTRLQGVPKHSASAWLKYTFQDGPLQGFGLGVGGTYVGGKSGDVNDSFSLPSYALLDAALYYENDDFRVQINFNNLTDKRHFTGSYDDLYVLPGEPFNVSASVTWKF